ncbi:MAG: SurA N-terminal domain-containing protein [Syntrophales bacterium]|nr:SurA N-terminal domain-containing protein [Syntrophales bacterium]
MLELMRKHAKNWIMKLLLGIIIIVFIFYFGSMGSKNKADLLVTIDGKNISKTEFQKEYQDTLEMYRQRFGGKLTDEMLKALKIKEQIIDKMVNESILMKKAQDLNISVSNDELKGIIASMQAFHRNGVFDERLYQLTLRQNHLTPDEFENMQRKTVLAAKLEDLLSDGVTVSDAEVFDFYKINNEKINLLYARLPISMFRKDVRPSTADLEKYLKDHDADFRVPEQVKLKVISFNGRAYGENIKVTDEEVQEAYNRYKGQQGKADKTLPLSSVKDKIINDIKQSKGMRVAYEEAKKAHDIIYQQNNFDAYAAQNRLQVETTAFFTSKTAPPDLRRMGDIARVAFTLQKDDISNVLSSESGYYLARLAEKKAAYTPSLKEIEEPLRERFTEDEARRLARQAAEKSLARMKSGESLKKVAAEEKLTAAETGFFLPAQPPSQLGSSPDIRRSLFQLSSKKPFADQAFFADGAFILVEFKERAQVNDSEFSSQRAGLKDALLRIKKSEALQSWLEKTKTAMIKDGRIKFEKEIKDL